MANFGNPAASAAMGNLPGMMMLAGGVASLAQGVFDGLDAANDALYARRYGDALHAATMHAHDMERIACASVNVIAQLEAEVASLREACAQRQEAIKYLSAART